MKFATAPSAESISSRASITASEGSASMTAPLVHVSGSRSWPPLAAWPERARLAQRRKLVRPLDAPGRPPPVESLHALDWLNFLVAALLMGFGPFVGLIWPIAAGCQPASGLS